MTYKANLGKLIFSPDDQLFRINKAKKVNRVLSFSFLLVFLSALLYGWMGWLGMGSDILSPGAATMAREEYEAAKFSFVIGRIAYALLVSLFLILVPPLFFNLFFRIAYPKAVLLQLTVLAVLLVERLLWIPLYIYFGMDWYSSPFSFGPIVSMFTEIPLWIYLGGSITLFFVWITWFQVYYMSKLTHVKKGWIWMTVLLLHSAYIFVAVYSALYADELITLLSGGWIR